MAPHDRPTWQQSWAYAWDLGRWVLLLVPICAAEPWALYKLANLPATNLRFYTISLAIMAFVFWLFMMASWIVQRRWSETPSQREAKERAHLRKLRAKYPDEKL